VQDIKSLAINKVINEIQATFKTSNKLIIQAPPGSGKSTLVPLCFLNQEYMQNKKIIVLQPRRVATIMVASQMANNLNQKLGEDIGYIIKNENIVNKNTKIIVVTEAILTRMLQEDQSLNDVSMVIFDEFHERSIHTDLALALSLQVQKILRDDLKILLMSATLNTQDAIKLLGDDTKVISTKANNYKVENIYLKKDIFLNSKNIYDIAFDTIVSSLRNDTGDILVFVDGIKNINLLQNRLNKVTNHNEILVLPLYSALAKKDQILAIKPNKKRKVILSTNIAQTSLTIVGVKVVVDIGYEKQSFYDNFTAMNKLHTKFITQDSATQRAGRAGRLSDGKCYKIWHENKILEPSDTPEILRSDLSSLLLDLALWGESIYELDFLDIPNEKFINMTYDTLFELDMIDQNKNITQKGKQCVLLGVHPRFFNMIYIASSLGFVKEACILASIFSSNYILKDNIKDQFIDILNNTKDDKQIQDIHKQANIYLKKFIKLSNQKLEMKKFDIKYLAILILFAYPDRLAKQRKKDSYLYKLSNGKGAELPQNSTLFNNMFLVVPLLFAKNKNSFINSAIKITIEDLRKYFKSHIKIKNEVIYDHKQNSLTIQQQSYIMNLKISYKNIALNEIENKTQIFIDLLQKYKLDILNIDEKTKQLINKIEFINKHLKDTISNISFHSLQNNIDKIIEPYLQNISTLKQLKELDIYNIVLSMLSYQEQNMIEHLAPTYIKVPSGSNIKIVYENDIAILKVKLQEIFTLMNTPKILDDTFALQIHILSPALRVVAITYDLKSFWDNSYEDVKKDLKSKYKKHYWPDDPYNAIATYKTKKNM
jgi:ATP-dependent helicase HrpB